MMTAAELIAAAAHCVRCGRPHERRILTDHRGSPFVTRSDPADGHMPRPLDSPYLDALRRIADAADSHHDATAAPGAGDSKPEPPATRTAPRRTTTRKPRSAR